MKETGNGQSLVSKSLNCENANSKQVLQEHTNWRKLVQEEDGFFLALSS